MASASEIRLRISDVAFWFAVEVSTICGLIRSITAGSMPSDTADGSTDQPSSTMPRVRS